jgi:hypothetical protein
MMPIPAGTGFASRLARRMTPVAGLIGFFWLGLGTAVDGQPPPAPHPVPFRAEIVTQTGARPGQDITVPLRLSSGGDRIDGFTVMIAFDSTVVKFREAVAGANGKRNQWRDFDCRLVPQSERESIYPLSLLRLSARRDRSAPPPPPGGDTTVEMARLTFSLIDDSRIACLSLPLQFFWRRCEDNIIYEAPGFKPRYVRRVFERFRPSTMIGDVDSVHGAIGVACLDGPRDIGPPAGDLDGDGTPGGATDLAILAELILRQAVDKSSRKNIYGGILSYAPDGTPLTLGSLVRLANPVPPESLVNLPPHGDILLLSIPPRPDTMKIFCQSTIPLGGLLLVFDVDGQTSSPRPSPAAAGMVTDFLAGDRSLRLIMFASQSRLLPAGIHRLVDVPYTGTVRLRTAAAVDRLGHPIKMIYLGD